MMEILTNNKRKHNCNKILHQMKNTILNHIPSIFYTTLLFLSTFVYTIEISSTYAFVILYILLTFTNSKNYADKLENFVKYYDKIE